MPLLHPEPEPRVHRAGANSKLTRSETLVLNIYCKYLNFRLIRKGKKLRYASMKKLQNLTVFIQYYLLSTIGSYLNFYLIRKGKKLRDLTIFKSIYRPG